MLTLKKNFLKEYGIAVVAYTGTEKDVKQVIKARDEEKKDGCTETGRICFEP